jgi:poly-beta-1,6-N-acetyl-D-glucosamine synthase
LVPDAADAGPLNGGRVAHEDTAPERTQRVYVSVAAKFTLSLVFTACWVGLSVWISRAWVTGLEPATGVVLAWVIVILVAYLPGAVVAFMTASLILDRQPPLRVQSPTAERDGERREALRH